MIKPASARWHAPAFGGFCSRQEHSYVCEVEIGVIEDSGQAIRMLSLILGETNGGLGKRPGSAPGCLIRRVCVHKVVADWAAEGCSSLSPGGAEARLWLQVFLPDKARFRRWGGQAGLSGFGSAKRIVVAGFYVCQSFPIYELSCTFQLFAKEQSYPGSYRLGRQWGTWVPGRAAGPISTTKQAAAAEGRIASTRFSAASGARKQATRQRPSSPTRRAARAEEACMRQRPGWQPPGAAAECVSPTPGRERHGATVGAGRLAPRVTRCASSPLPGPVVWANTRGGSRVSPAMVTRPGREPPR